MSYLGARARRRRFTERMVPVVVFAVAAAVIVWAIAALFPAELHQVTRWLAARITAIRG